MMQRRGPVAVAVLCASLAAGCAGGEGSGGSTGGRLAKLTIIMSGDYDSLDPAKTTLIFGNQMAVGVYERLVHLDADNKPSPGLAESWKVTATDATFKIRDGSKCSDGTKVTATVVADSLKRYVDPKTATPFKARVFGSGDVTIEPDDAAREVHITLSKPFSEMLTGLAMPWTSIICPAGITTAASAPVGSGPFTYDTKASVRGNEYVLNLRSDEASKPEFKGLPSKVVLRVIPDTSTIANEMASGSADIAQVVPDQVKVLEGNKALTRTNAQALGSYFLMYRQDAGSLFADNKLREAVSLSIDREALAQAATRGFGEAAVSYYPKSVPCAYTGTAGKGAEFNAAASEKAFAAAGYQKSSGGGWAKNGTPLRVRLVASSNNTPAGTEYLGNQLRTAGVDVKIQQYPISDLLEFLGKSKDWDVALFPYQPPIPSPNSATSFFRDAKPGVPGTNFGRINNSAFSDAVNQAQAASPDDPGRCAFWQASQKAVIDAVNVSPMYTPSNIWFSTSRAGALPFIGPGTINLPSLSTKGQ